MREEMAEHEPEIIDYDNLPEYWIDDVCRTEFIGGGTVVRLWLARRMSNQPTADHTALVAVPKLRHIARRLNALADEAYNREEMIRERETSH